jgi:PIN domain nuclease of toxin-antitoxin system
MTMTDFKAKCLRVVDDLGPSGIVLWEMAKLVQLGRLEMDLEDATYLRCLERIRAIPISPQIARLSTEMNFKSDPADEIIAATSVTEGIPLVTRDRIIRRSKVVPLALQAKRAAAASSSRANASRSPKSDSRTRNSSSGVTSS